MLGLSILQLTPENASVKMMSSWSESTSISRYSSFALLSFATIKRVPIYARSAPCRLSCQDTVTSTDRSGEQNDSIPECPYAVHESKAIYLTSMTAAPAATKINPSTPDSAAFFAKSTELTSEKTKPAIAMYDIHHMFW